jgi:diguanylate cyclase (GGDEF)-like protein/PAS domain S-box-containing protein
MSLAVLLNRATLPIRVALLQSWSRNLSIMVMLMGSIVIVGWIFDSTVLKSIFPGFPTMKANTAACFIFSGISLRLWHQHSTLRLTRYIAQALALLVSAIGFLTLMEYGLNVDLNIDQLIFRTSIGVGNIAPGRMAIYTASNFLLLGTALWRLHLRRAVCHLTQLLIGIPSLIAFLAVLGYLYDSAALYRGGTPTAIAFHTAITFLLLCIGMLLARPDQGVVAIFVDETAGGILARRLVPTAIVIPPLICWLSLLGSRLQLYTPELRVALVSVADVGIFTALVWRSAMILQAIAHQHHQVDQTFQQTTTELEQRVAERTASLRRVNRELRHEILVSQVAEYERWQAEIALRQINETLELRVAERTAELTEANDRLHQELSGRQLAEVALRESEAQYRVLAEVSPQVIWMGDSTGYVTYCNRYWFRYTGLTMGQTLGDGWISALHPEDQDRVLTLWRQSAASGSHYEVEVRLRRSSDGEYRWFMVRSQPFHNSLGQIVQWVGIANDVHDRKQVEIERTRLLELEQAARAELETERSRLEQILQQFPSGVIIAEAPSGKIQFHNHEVVRLLGHPFLSSETYEDYRQYSAFHADGRLYQPQEFPLFRALSFGELVRSEEVHYRRTDGSFAVFSTNSAPIFDLEGRIMAAVSTFYDISERKRAEEALFQEKELAQVTLRSIGDAVITTDALGRIQYLNPIAEALTGWTQSEAQGLPLPEVFQIINETTRERVINPVEKALQENGIVGLANHTILIARNGHEFAIDDSAAPIRGSDGQVIGAVLVFHDVTQNRSLAKQLSWQASYDGLTGLVNRREFENRLEQAVSTAQTDNLFHALCYLDLDQFKVVNDTCGHVAGDELLRQVAALFQTQIRKSDTLARLGGDEFGVLLNQCPLEKARQVANELREQVQNFRFVWQDKQFAIGVSIGLVVIDAHSGTTMNVLSAADAACYVSKNKGRNRVHVYQADDLELAQQQGEMQWATRLTQALEDDRFHLYYQQIFPLAANAANSEPIGEHYEVLLRLQDESGELVSPMAFVPAAERYNLMQTIDRWVIRTLFATQGRHYQEVWSHCHLQAGKCNSLYAINLSGTSINDDQFIDFLHEQFALHQIPPQLICFEITETVAISNLAKAAQLINELRSLGCRFALDDFGSGMSSFAYLKHLPVDFIKIDGGFIKHIVNDPIDTAIVEAINQIGQVMGIQTIAEFVESDAILDKVRALGVNYAQGYSIAEPCPLIAS